MDVLCAISCNLRVLSKFLVNRLDEYSGDEEDDVKDSRKVDLSVAVDCTKSQITRAV